MSADPALDATAKELRLFLSVDIVGSTALKHRRNHHELYERYNSGIRVINAARVSKQIRERLEDGLLNELRGLQLDWARIVELCLQAFNTQLATQLTQFKQDTVIAEYEMRPWKALGDELVYSYRVSSVEQAHRLVSAFLRAVRLEDARWAPQDEPEIRLKAAAWIAGFPVNNRKVKLPFLDGVRKGQGRRDSPWPQMDYLGPDMDIGFRIGKCTWAGMCVVALSLAQFLASDKNVEQKLKLAHVGWESLKGVWGEQPYPVIWAELNEDKQHGARAEIAPSAEEDCKFIKKWNKGESAKAADAIEGELELIRASLPPTFGAVVPYVPGGGASASELEHAKIQNIASRVEKAERQHKAQDPETGSTEPRSKKLPKEMELNLPALENRATVADDVGARSAP